MSRQTVDRLHRPLFPLPPVMKKQKPLGRIYRMNGANNFLSADVLLQHFLERSCSSQTNEMYITHINVQSISNIYIYIYLICIPYIHDASTTCVLLLIFKSGFSLSRFLHKVLFLRWGTLGGGESIQGCFNTPLEHTPKVP